MDKKQLYTAMSRTKKFEYIHINQKELNNKYLNRQQPILELTNSKFSSLHSEGKIYKVIFDDDYVYIGSSWEELETRYKWHLSNKNSQVYKDKDKNPKIELMELCPSKGRKSLEKVENGYVEEYAEKYGKKLLNVRHNPNKKAKKIEFQVKMENEKQLRKRIGKLDKKLTIKDDERWQKTTHKSEIYKLFRRRSTW